MIDPAAAEFSSLVDVKTEFRLSIKRVLTQATLLKLSRPLKRLHPTTTTPPDYHPPPSPVDARLRPKPMTHDMTYHHAKILWSWRRYRKKATSCESPLQHWLNKLPSSYSHCHPCFKTPRAITMKATHELDVGRSSIRSQTLSCTYMP